MNNQIEEILSKELKFSIGGALSEGSSLFKKGAMSLIGFGVLTIIMYVSAMFVNGIIRESVPFLGVLTMIATIFLYMALMAGYYPYLRKLKNGNADFSSFFSGLKKFGPITGFILVYFLIFLGMSFVFGLLMVSLGLMGSLSSINPADPESFIDAISMSGGTIGIIIILYLIFLCALTYVSMIYMLTIPFISDFNLGVTPAMKLSRKLVHKNFWNFFGLGFVIIVIYLVVYLVLSIFSMISPTVFAFIAGVVNLVIMGWVVSVLFSAYDIITQVDSIETLEDKIDSFGATEKDINTESEENKVD